MRALCLLTAAALGLVLTSCTGGPVRTDAVVPVSKYKEMIVGKWQPDSEEQLIQGYEFGADGKMTMTVKGMKEPVEGKYTWVGDREIEIEYTAAEGAKKAYAAEVRAYKEPGKKAAEGGDRMAVAAKKGLDMIPDELPEKEKAKVILGAEPHPILIVTWEQGFVQNFKKAK